MAGGYMGRFLKVDLSRGQVLQEPLDVGLCRSFIGGYGLGARLLYNWVKPGTDPLGAENVLGIITGPLTGTPALGGSRYTAVGKSPLTGTWGDANSGGYFGPALKFSGYDAVFFDGAADQPVYLFINGGEAELRDAAHVWGKDTHDTEDILRSELGSDVEVACIGPSGEKLSLIAAIINNKGRAAARSGLGAVMGSKKLKAIAVKGKLKVPLADAGMVEDLRKRYLKDLGGPYQILKAFGTPSGVIPCIESGDSPVKNWGGAAQVDYPDSLPVGIDALMKYQAKRYACYRCPVGCGGHMKAGTGEYVWGAGVHKPEYETIAMFGPDCLNTSIESIIKLNDLCNRYGLDTISTGAVLAFAIECYENGLIGKADTDGVEMTWGNHGAMVTMTEKIARREGFGDVLADGVRKAAERIGKNAEQYAIHIGGQEVPAHDPKFAIELATTYRLDATPARHTQGSEERNPPGLIPEFDRSSFSGRAEAHKIGSNMSHAMSSSGLCAFVYGCLPHVSCFAEFMQAVTGWDISVEELLKTGERIANMRMAFNLREGLNPLEFGVPGRVIGKPPLKEGPLAGVTIDEDTLFTEYLAAMDWDRRTMRPSRQKLLELGLGDLVEDLT